jgi:hypothetical protein
MATAANNPSLILNISGTPSVALKRGEKTSVMAKTGQRYRVVKEGEEEAAKDVAASQKGQDLVLTYADGTQVVLVNFYQACKAEQCAVEMPGVKGTGASGGYVITGDSPVGASQTDGGKLVYAFGETSSMVALTQGAQATHGLTEPHSQSTHIPVSEGTNYLLPLGLAVGALAAGGGSSQGGTAVPSPTPTPTPTPPPPPTSTDKLIIINGSVVAGPVIAGNGLKVVAYKANGTALAGGSGDLNADGTFTLTLTEAYTGPVLLYVYDTSTGPDYFDEATGAAKDLGTDLRAVTHLPAAGTYTVNINILTELAVRKLGLSGGDGGAASVNLGNTTAEQINNVNQQVASAVALTQDLVMGSPAVAVITTVGAVNSAANHYGRMLAAISGAEVSASSDEVLNILLSSLSATGLSAAGVELLVAGAQRVSNVDATLTTAVLDLTYKPTAAIGIAQVASDNFVTASEKAAGVNVTGTATANALVTITWGASTQTTMANAQGQWATTFAASQIPGDGASSITATQGTGASQQLALRGVFVVTALPSTLRLQLATDSGVSASDGITKDGTVAVSQVSANAAWQYSTDGGSTWQSGSGNSFTLGAGLYAPASVTVRQTDAAGNTSAVSAIASALTVDTTAPTGPNLSLNNNQAAVNVSGIEAGASWQYSTDGGNNWTVGTSPSTGNSSSFTLPTGTYATGTVKVRQTDAAGNTSAASASTASITIAPPNNGAGSGSGTAPDTTSPTVTISSSATSLAANATATLTFTLSEAIADFGVNSVTVSGGALSNFSGSGTSYTATFTPEAGLSGAATVNVAASALTDAAGNSNSAASNTVSITVDTQAPAVASITASRSSLLVDQTAHLSITLSEASTTFALADLQAVGGTLSNLAGSGISYTATFTPDDNRTDAGSVSVIPRSFSDAAGNFSQRSDSDGVVMAIQTLRPTATLTARQTKLGMGDVTTIDITLSEKSTDFVVGDLTASHGTLSEFRPLGDGIRYSVVFTPEASFTGSGSVTLADGRFTNAAGNSNKGVGQAASTDSLAIDTTPPTVNITSDVSALAIGQSAKITFTFNKDPGDSFDAKDITVNGGTLTNLVNNTGTIWTARFTPTDGGTGQASITVASGRYTDTAGNKGTAGTTPVLTIDTQGPVADSLLPGNASTVLPGQALVLTFSEVVRKGSGNLVLVNDTANTRSTLAVTDSSVVLSNDGKTLTITPTTALVAGSQYHVEADPASLLDAAGNAWAGIAASSTWAGSGWRFTAATPSVSLNRMTDDNRVNRAENTAGVLISGTIESNTAGMVADFVAGDFAITLTPQGGGNTITAAASSYNTNTGAWSLTLPSNALVDGKTYDVSVVVTGTTGTASGATANTTGKILVDLSAAAPTLTLLNDTGSNNSDGKTSDATISVALEPKASWEYSTDSGSTWLAGSGNQFSGASTEGAHTVLVRQTDAAGNVSSNGSLSFNLDATADKPVINAIATNDIINASEVGSAITGTAEAGASVTLSLGSGHGQGSRKFISLGQSRHVTVTADSHGDWSYTLTAADLAALGNGQTQVVARQTDVSGNSSFSTLRNITVDTWAPTVSIESSQTQLNAATPISVLAFTLSENSTDFTASSVTVMGGTLSNFAGSGTQYSATFTPTNAATTAGSVKVAAGAFRDAAGNTNAEASNLIELSVDTVVPNVAVTSSASTLLAGETATLTFTLSEASDSFGADRLIVVGGTLGPLSANATRTAYTGVFTPKPYFSGSGSVSVANNAFFDRGGNANADGTDPNNSVDLTIQGEPVALNIRSDKMGLKAGETATISFTFTAAPTGFAADDITVAGGTLGALTTVDSTHYTSTFTPTASAASGKASISVAKGSYTGGGGNLGVGGSVAGITLDTLAPTLKTLNPEDNGFLAAGNALVATFTEVVSAGTGSIRLVDDTNTTTVTYDITDSAIAIDGDTLTLTPSTTLVAGHNYHLSIDNTALVDAAGNAYVGIANATSWNFGATNLSTTLNPVTGDGRINDDEKTAGPIVLSGKVSSLNPAVLSALTASDIVVRVTVPRDGGWNDNTDKILTCTGVTYDSATGEWTATLPISWVYDGFLSDTTTTTLINGDTDTIRVTITGRSGTAAAGLTATLTDTMTVDLSDPATPTLTLAGDTGSSNSDGITRNGLINVGALEVGGSWQYSLDNGSSWQADTGSSFVIPKDGSANVQVMQTDAAGNASVARSLAVTLDTQADAPVVNAVATDNRINASETTSAITGTADANASVSLVMGANTRTVTANSSGVWSYTLVAGDITAMGQGNEVIQVTQADKAGNTSAATKAVIEVDTVLPTVTLANTGSASLLAGQSTTFTATLSELSASFSADSLTLSGGTVTQFKADATGLVYTGTFTPDSNSTKAGSIVVAASAVSDEAGNTNSAASNTLALTVNTVRPTVAITSSVAASTTLHAGDTANVTFTLSAVSSDFTAADVTTVGGTLSNFAGSGTVYTATFTPDANSRAPGSVSVSSGTFANAATNINADGADDNNKVSFAIATARPTLTISSDLGTLGGAQTAQITFTFSEDPGASFVVGDISTTNGSSQVTGTLSAFKGAGNVYTAVFTPTPGFAGAAVISVANGLYTNADGSLGQAAGSPALTIDAVAPTVAISRSGSGTLGVGQTDTITFDFSEAPGSSLALEDIDVIGGTMGALSAVSATQYVATFTPEANAIGTANLRVANGRFSDAAGNNNADGTDANNLLAIAYATGNSNSGSVTSGSVPTLSLSADTGASATDGITNNGVIEVTALKAGATWEYSLDGGANWLAGSGSSFTLPSAGVYTAAAGSSQLQVRQSAAGVTSSVGKLAADVDFRPSYIGNVSVELSNDSGISATDAITNLGLPRVSGPSSDTYRTSIDNGLNWSIYSVPPPVIYNGQTGGQDKSYVVLIEATDLAGNTRSLKYGFRQDNVKPEAPNVQLTANPDDGGAIVEATNIEAGASVFYKLRLGDTNLYQSQSTYTPPTSPGTYSLFVQQMDVAGNLSKETSLTFNLAAPGFQLSSASSGSGSFVINGGTTTRLSGANVSIDGELSGFSVSAAGDVNGDGLGDLILGAIYANDLAGRNYVVFGKTTAAPMDLTTVAAGTGGFVINGESAKSSSGYSVSSAGDVNGDGLTDLIVGAEEADNGKGRSYVVYGKTTGTAIDLSSVVGGTGGFVIYGESTSYRIGKSVSAAGDVNGDGLADLILGTTSAWTKGGRSFVLFGKTDNAAINLSLMLAGGGGGFVINGDSTTLFIGQSVSAAGDVNGDGLADLVVGANDPRNLSGGRSYVVFGKTSVGILNMSAVANGSGGFAINGDKNTTQSSGWSVSAAGDVNGDGLADLIVGAPDASDKKGRSYVVFGKTTSNALNLTAVAAGVGGFVINGDGASQISGFSVSSAGDVNGDGLSDLILGAPEPKNLGGRSYVVFGKTTGTAMDLSAVQNGSGGFAINGDSTSQRSGHSVSAAGDVNGDGLADLIIGASEANDFRGRTYVIFGNTTGVFAQSAVDWMGTDGADTRSDNGTASTLVAGAGNDNLTATAASVLYGGAGNDTFTIDQAMITALQSPFGEGGNLGQLARIDGGSGIDSLVLSGSGLKLDLTKIANQAGGNPDGGSRIDSVEVIDLTGSGNNALVLTARDVQDMAGMNLFNSGNGWTGLAASVARHQLRVEGNSGDLLTLGAEWVSAGIAINNGVTYKVYNASAGAQLLVNSAVKDNLPESIYLMAVAAGVGGFVVNGGSASKSSGYSVSSAGDVNGDGLTDLIVGAPLVGNGRSFVVFGKTSSTAIDLIAVQNGVGGFLINWDPYAISNGNSVSAAGDVNGDGLADLIVGAPYNNAQGGSSYVVFGKTTGTPIDLNAVRNGSGGFLMEGDYYFCESGFSVSAAGDVNGDGLADLIVGSPLTSQDRGFSFVVFGKVNSTRIDLWDVADGTGGFVIMGNDRSMISGYSVSSAGDVNGDGLADLLVGAPNDPFNNGRSYVVFGKVSGTAVNLSAVANGSGGFVVTGDSTSLASGFSVSAAGDVNGDGLADLIIGAPLGNNYDGRSYVVFGKSSGTAIGLSAVASGTGGFVINGDSTALLSGYSVSAAGDVNGDGLADLIIGTPLANDGGGRSYVVFGKSTGAAINLSAVSAGVGGIVINGDSSSLNSGNSVSAAGDVNGDGLADLLVGAYGANDGGGSSYVIFGNTSGAFGQTLVNWLGTSAADTQSDGGTARTLVAGAGNDTLTATAASVLYGGVGNDTFTINQAMVTALQSPMGAGGNLDRLSRVDGGGGVDKILLSGSGLTFDLTKVANQAASNPDGGSRMDGVEIFDITGTGNNTLKLTSKDVLELGSANVFNTVLRQKIMVMGNSGDKLDLADGTGTAGWSKASANAAIDGLSYEVWNCNTNLATVYVQTGVVVG